MNQVTVQAHFDLVDVCYEKNKTLLHSFFLDWLGCLVAGLNAPKCRALLQSLQESTSDSKTVRLSEYEKAMLFGFASHCLEIDDSEFIGETHPSCVLFSSILSSHNDSANMTDVLKAASVGYLSLVSFGRCLNPTHYEKGWHGTGTVGSLAATVSLGYFNKLSAEQTSLSLGVVSNLLSGIHMNFGTEAKFLAAGGAARNSILATRLVTNGMGSKEIRYSGPKGFNQMYGGIEADYLKPEVIDFSFVKAKSFPVCHCLDPILMNFQDMLMKAHLLVDDIDSIEIDLSTYSRNILVFDFPENEEESKFSVSSSIENFSRSFFAKGLSGQSPVQKGEPLSKKVKVNADTRLSEMDHRIVIKAKGGRVFDKTFRFDRGFKVQDRSYIKEKTRRLILPYIKKEMEIESFFDQLEVNLKEGTLFEFKKNLQKNFRLPESILI